MILKTVGQVNKETADKTLKFCNKNDILTGYDWEQVAFVLEQGNKPEINLSDTEIKPLNNEVKEKMGQYPKCSNIDDYEDRSYNEWTTEHDFTLNGITYYAEVYYREGYPGSGVTDYYIEIYGDAEKTILIDEENLLIESRFL